MIVTVTMNPALDKTVHVDVLRPLALNRIHDPQVDAGGKGLNVSAVIAALGGESVAAGFAAGGAGDELLALSAMRGLRSLDFVRVKGSTRTNLKVIDAGGGLTELNEPGPQIEAGGLAALEAKLASYAAPWAFFVLSGSLPPGVPADIYRSLCTRLRSAGAKVFVDADGPAFRLAMEAPPDFVKPNRHELLEFFGMDEKEALDDSCLAGLCRKLVKQGISLVALSMGADGALFVNNSGAWRAPPLDVAVGSTVGAGDAMVGALTYALDRGDPPEACFTLAMAASAAAVTTPGTGAPDLALVERLRAQVTLRKMED
jgi:1-phosphofructokinase